MLYFFYGIDSKKAGERARGLIDKMLEKKPDASLFVIDEENCNQDTLLEMTQSSALFQNKYIVHIKKVLNNKESEGAILNFLKEIKKSENIFIWSEGEVKKTVLTKIENVSEKTVDVGGKKEEYNGKKIFDICGPIIERDKKNLWIKYQDMLDSFAVEEIHGTIFWQFKNIAIASRSSQKDSGIGPYPYSNAKKALSNYSEKEIFEKTSELAKIVHESRSGGSDLGVLLERFILNI